MNPETKLALDLLRGSPEYVSDAREGAPVGNSVVGSLLSLQHGIPRQYAEKAVLDAVGILDREEKAAARAAATEFTLPRSGKAPLRFRGLLLAESDGEWQAGRDHTRWHDIAVYRTGGGKYVVTISLRSRYENEIGYDYADIVAEPAQVEAVFRGYDPCARVRGYPDGAHYAERNARLMANIRARYDAQVAEILEASPEFAEEIT
jgi:hypothetical protein